MEHKIFFIILFIILAGFAGNALAVSPDVFPKNPLVVPSLQDSPHEFEDNINPGAQKYNPSAGQGPLNNANNNSPENNILKKIAPSGSPLQAIVWITAISAVLIVILIFAIQKIKKE